MSDHHDNVMQLCLVVQNSGIFIYTTYSTLPALESAFPNDSIATVIEDPDGIDGTTSSSGITVEQWFL